MKIAERYQHSHQYRKGKLAVLEVILIVSVPAAVAACIYLSGTGLGTRTALCSIYASIPAILYGYISIHSQFLTPSFARLRVSRSGDRLMIHSPRFRWVILIGPWIVVASGMLALTFSEPDAMSRWGDRPAFIQFFSGAAIVLLLPFARSRFTVSVGNRVAEGTVVWGPMDSSFRTDPIESLEVGVQSGIKGQGYIERRWFGSSRGRRAEFNPSLDLVVLNNAYVPLRLSDISDISGIDAKVGK